MNISGNGLTLIKAFEGCLKSIGNGRFKPYICPAGVLTIGWGHTNAHGRQFNAADIWTQAECDAEFASDMVRFEAAVNQMVKVTISQSQFDALVSFAYNCGESNLAKSTLLRRVNEGNFAGALNEFAKWNKGGGKILPGLVRRRKAEALLFQGSVANALLVAGASRIPMPQQVDLPTETRAKNTRATATIAIVGGTVVGAKTAMDQHGIGGTVVVLIMALLVGFVLWRFWPKRRG